ncbi:hypothetical protein ACJIZ3_006962 [Penstemon smallii]|uniref:Uncharacterized protein n=1 Tax=Penstemon smallii TaxID=265156 RepID=A0ABD3S994_9LAMI
MERLSHRSLQFLAGLARPDIFSISIQFWTPCFSTALLSFSSSSLLQAPLLYLYIAFAFAFAFTSDGCRYASNFTLRFYQAVNNFRMKIVEPPINECMFNLPSILLGLDLRLDFLACLLFYIQENKIGHS